MGASQPVTEGKPHPRAYGAFPRKLARYVRDRGVVDLPFAIRSMTALSAEVFGDQGSRASCDPAPSLNRAVFELAAVKEAATYEQPHQLAEGLDDDRHQRRDRPRRRRVPRRAARPGAPPRAALTLFTVAGFDFASRRHR